MSDILVKANVELSRGNLHVCGFASGRAVLNIDVGGVTVMVHATMDDLAAITDACRTVRRGMHQYAQVAA